MLDSDETTLISFGRAAQRQRIEVQNTKRTSTRIDT
jgi:hypothetical protein